MKNPPANDLRKVPRCGEQGRDSKPRLQKGAFKKRGCGEHLQRVGNMNN